MKPTWTHTHNGEQGEELCECEGKFYTRHAWDNFLGAYTGRVRRAGPDWRATEFVDLNCTEPMRNGVIDFFSDGETLYPAGGGISFDFSDIEITEPMIKPIK